MPHTRGPWTFEDCRYAQKDPDALLAEGCDFWIVGNSEVLANTNRVQSGDQEANARLMASSPDLLASAKEFVALYDDVTDMVSAGVRAKVERARAAIAKAEGR